jgi:hypothetical protein
MLPRSATRLAIHDGAAWLAAGASGVLRVALDDFGSPHLDGTWQPEDPGGNRVSQVVDVVGLDRSLLAMVAFAHRTAATVDHANLMTALSHEPGQGIRQSSVYTVTATAFRWGGQGDMLAYSAVDHIRVLDFQDPSHPAIAAAPTKRATTMAGLLPVRQGLAVVYDNPLLVEGHDLARGGRRSGDARLTLEGERRPLLLAGDDQRILVADESSFVVVPMTPAPAVVRPLRISSSIYQRLRPSTRGLWLIDDRGGLSLSDREGAVLGRGLLEGERLTDVAEAGDDLVGIVPRLGARVLAEAPSGRFKLGRQLPQFPEDWLILPLDLPWLWLRASPTHVMATSTLLMALAARGTDGYTWVGHLDDGFTARAQVHLEDDVIYVASGTLQRLRATGEGMLQVEQAPSLRWPASAPPLSMTGAQERFLVGDSGGLVTRVHWREDDARVLWSLDMPGPVQQLAQANEVGWALWSIPGAASRGGGPPAGPPIASGISAFRLGESDTESLGTIALAADAIDLYAHEDGLWVLGEDGAVSMYALPQPRSPLMPAPTATSSTSPVTPSVTPQATGVRATPTRAATAPTPIGPVPAGSRVWLPWAWVE